MKPINTGADEPEKKKRSAVNRLLGIVVNAILIFAILFGFFCSFTAFISKSGSGVPSFFGVIPFAIQSDSMAPTFNKGDLIVDRSMKDPSELKTGDIITFWTVINGERVLNSHRITEIEDKGTYLYFNTKGDNNTIEDSIGVHQSEIVGRYAFSIPGIGTVIDYLQTGTGFLIVIVIPVFLFFVYHLVQFFRTLFAYQAEKLRLQLEKEQLEKENSKAKGSEGEQAANPTSAGDAQHNITV